PGFQTVNADDDEEDDTSPYIINGKVTKRCNIPYIVKLKIFRSTRSVTYCSGSLLDNYHVLTAGHCILKKKVKTIRVDVIIRTKRKIKRFRVKDWVIHKGYKFGTILVNDIAVLTLKKPVQYNACVKPIRLPRKDDHITRVCTISGWGFTKGR
ncbi:chymotrypsin-1-like, partial [Octopus sinensis]|uniref:Chymotrypsin-1-like n=1 Tax=Octopus sinensis TaxID=2607531 RepID=A0A7E6EG88_9MOLL